MRVYDVDQGKALAAHVRVQDGGQKEWDLTSDWRDFWLDADIQADIMRAIDHAPDQEIFLVQGFMIKQRHHT